MLEQIQTILEESCLLVPDVPIVVGVSGGPDSTCLLDILHHAGYSLVVAHFNHGLRSEAEEDARVVEKLASQLGYPFVLGLGDVYALVEKEKMSVEEAARELRYNFLFEQARLYNAQAVAAGHTADDQVETVLMNFIRGAGLNGLKGMSYRMVLPLFDPGIPIVRPLLGVWHEEALLHCAAQGLNPVFDRSNDMLDFTRNRIRHVLMPALESYNNRFKETVWRTAKVLADDYAALVEIVDESWDACVVRAGAGFVVFDVSSLVQLPVGLQRNIFRRALKQVRPDTRDISFSVLDRCASFTNSKDPSGQIDVVNGVRMLFEGDTLLLAVWEADFSTGEWPQVEVEKSVLEIPGSAALGDGWQISCETWHVMPLVWEKARNNEDPFQAWLDADLLIDPLELRSRRDGDRFQPLGIETHTVKVSDLFINHKLPSRARNRWPLVCQGDEIIWIPGFQLAHPYRITKKTHQAIYFTLTKRGGK
ncbi:MAG: tRNA lysidine(34) synthetase TilS [Anaerolineales bacterium]|nr:tRNA lysidine(34) synthetase TilS [Anaerolineales bacterium]